jgi:CTP synthase (UTP-ammonia lyase)
MPANPPMRPDTGKSLLRIAIIGEFDPALPSHRATNEALAHAAEHLSVAVQYSWLPSTTLAENNFADALIQFDGLWTAPGGPYRSMEGVLSAIRWAREHDWPYFAT